MKRKIRNYLFLASLLCLTCAFVDGPETYRGSSTKESVSAAPVGGAFLSFAGKNGGEITKKEVGSQSELMVEGCAKGSKILKYTLEITKGGHTTSLHAESNKLSAEIQSKLKSLSAGDSFEFTQIKALLPNGKDVVDVHGQKFIVV